MKFVIYGAGYRGVRLFRYLGSGRVIAFIDSNATKTGNTIGDTPIINLVQYVNQYMRFPIIISPSNSSFIVKTLNNRSIFHYSILSDLPSEFAGYGTVSFEDCYRLLLKKYAQTCYLYGMNAFSLTLFHELQTRGNKVYFLQRDEKISGWIKETLGSDAITASPSEQGVIFLCCYANVKEIERTFPIQHIIDAFDFSSNLPIYYNQKIDNLKNAFFRKRRCFIVATGASLRTSDLDRLKETGDFCFGVNKIFKIKSTWRPDAYVVTDSFLLQEAQDDLAKYDVPLKFFGDGNFSKEAEKQNEYVIHVVGGQYLSAPPPFSENIAQKVYGGGTVTYACIQIAVYLGFKEIYLLGVDCNYSLGSKSNHFYDEDKPDLIERNMEQMISAFQAAKNYADSHGIKIYNATRGGNLEVFARVDFDRLF